MPLPSPQTHARSALIFCALTTFISIGVGPAFAQGRPAVDDEKVQAEREVIIVTGQRRDERLIETPLSATILNQQAIIDARINSLRDLDDVAPNVSFNQLGQIGGTYLTIRGVESNPFIVNRAAVYIDGIPFRELDEQSLAFATGIELLRGPQSTLYGANSESGVALVRTRGPSDQFEAEVRADTSWFGNGQGLRLDGFVAGPMIAGSLAGSLSISAASADSFVRNIASSINEPGRLETLAGKARLRWTPSEMWTVNLLLQASKLDAPGLYEQEFPALNLAAYNTRYGNPGFNGALRAGRFDLIHDAPKGTTENEWAVGIETIARLGWSDLTLVASWREKDEDSRGTDLDLTAAPFAAGATTSVETYLNLEARLSSPREARTFWTVGLSYYADTRTQQLATLIGPGGLNAYRPAPPQNREGSDVAVFGQITYPISDTLKVTGGLRVEHAQRQRKQAAGSLDLGFAGQFVFVANDLSDTYNDVLPRVAVNWQVQDNISLYASLAKGWIPGGFNLEAARGTPAEAFSRYGAETLWSGEIGFKADLVPGRTFIAAALFRIEADNWQEYNVLLDSQGLVASTSLITSNSAIVINGGEIEVTSKPIERLELRAGLGISSANYSRYKFTAAQDFTGNKVKLVPEWDLNLSATWRPSKNVFARIDLGAQGDMPLNADNTATQKAYSTLGLQLGYETDRWSVRLYGENLTDERVASGSAYTNFLFGPDGTLYAPLGAPRVVGLSASVQW